MTDSFPFPATPTSPPSEQAKPPLADEIERNLYPKPEPEVPKAPPKVVFKGGERSKDIPLLHPFALDGVDYDSVTVKRLTTGEVSAYLDSLRGLTDGETRRFPIWLDQRGQPLSDDFWKIADDDDTTALNKEAEAFLPKRFLLAASATDIPPATSSSTPAGSDTSASS